MPTQNVGGTNAPPINTPGNPFPDFWIDTGVGAVQEHGIYDFVQGFHDWSRSITRGFAGAGGLPLFDEAGAPGGSCVVLDMPKPFGSGQQLVYFQAPVIQGYGGLNHGQVIGQQLLLSPNDFEMAG